MVSGQEGRTQDHARPEAFVHLALEATVVVRQRIEGEVFHQIVETDRNGRRPFQIGSLNRGIELEDTSGFIEFTGDIFRRNSLDGTRRSSNSSTSTCPPSMAGTIVRSVETSYIPG